MSAVHVAVLSQLTLSL